LKPVSELPTHTASEPVKQFCRTHTDKEVEYFCKTDSRFVCATCASAEHAKPQHDAQPLADLLAEAQAALATACAKVEAVRTALDSGATSLAAKLRDHCESGNKSLAAVESVRLKVGAG
jgi:hypothetical protein